MLALMVVTLGGLFLVFMVSRRRRGTGADAALGELALAGAAAGGAMTAPPPVRHTAAPKPSGPPKSLPAMAAAAAITPPPTPKAPPPATAPAISPLLAAKAAASAEKKASGKKGADKKGADKNAAAKAPAKGNERFRIGYRSVRIGDGPDEFRSTELGRLDRGDEVEILGSHEGFLQVRTPAGLTGWIPRHTITGSPITGS